MHGMKGAADERALCPPSPPLPTTARRIASEIASEIFKCLQEGNGRKDAISSQAKLLLANPCALRRGSARRLGHRLFKVLISRACYFGVDKLRGLQNVRRRSLLG